MESREGDAKADAATRAMPPMSPETKQATATAKSGFFCGSITPYSPGSVTPAKMAEMPEAAASCLRTLSLLRTATARQEAPSARFAASIAGSISISPSGDSRAASVTGINAQCMPVITR